MPATRAPLLVLCRVTTVCPLACSFCGYDRRLRVPRRQLRFATLAGAAREWIADLRREGRGGHWSWLGGEPLLWPELVAANQALREQGWRLSLTTSGVGSERPGMLAHLADCLDELTFSIDAPDALHDRIRGQPGVAARVRRVIQELRARQRRPLLRLNSVLTRTTLPHFEDLLAGWCDSGIDEWSLNLVGGRDRPDTYPMEGPDAEAFAAWRARLPEWRRRLARCGVRLLGSPGYYAGLEEHLRGGPRPAGHRCRPGQDLLFIDEAGRVAPCAFTGETLATALPAADLAALATGFAGARRTALPAVCHDCPSTQLHGKFECASAGDAPGTCRPKPSHSPLPAEETPG